MHWSTETGADGAKRFQISMKSVIRQRERSGTYLPDRQDAYGKIRNMNFQLVVEEHALECRSINTFTQEIEYEVIAEGGCSDTVHIRKKPLAKPFTFQVERYVQAGHQDVLEIGSFFERLILEISARPGDFSAPQVSFIFYGCLVSGKSYNGMNAEKSDLLVETTTIVYEQLEVTSNSLV